MDILTLQNIIKDQNKIVGSSVLWDALLVEKMSTGLYGVDESYQVRYRIYIRITSTKYPDIYVPISLARVASEDKPKSRLIVEAMEEIDRTVAVRQYTAYRLWNRFLKFLFRQKE